MRRLILRIFFWASLIGCFSVLILISYGFYLVSELNKNGGLEFDAMTRGSDSLPVSVSFELDSFVHQDDLKKLAPFLEDFSDEGSFSNWLDKSIESETLTRVKEVSNKELLQVETPFEFELRPINDCERVYCYQRRMNFSDIPSSLWRGLIGVEDSRFLKHKGVDFRALVRALLVDLKSMEFVQGGSTLTQQLVKNLFFSNEKTITRKIKEMLLSFYIEAKYEKEEILQAYFNEVVWGSLAGVRIKGVYGASLFYFAKEPNLLTDYESSILSALLKGPYYYHPLKNLEGLRKRTELVYGKLIESNFVSSEDVSRWGESQWFAWQKTLQKKNTDHRFKAIAAALKEDDSFYDYYIWSTVIGERIAQLKKREHLQEKDLAAKVYVRDLVNCPELEDECDDFVYYSKRERDLEVGIKHEKTQVGSILKPLIYQSFFREKFKREDVVSLAPLELDLLSGKWGPKEATDLEVEEETLEEALKFSRNIPVIRLAQEYGFEALEGELEYYLPTMKKPLSEYPAQLLGAIELSPFDVSNVYHKFIKTECGEIDDGDQDSEDSVLYLLSDPRETTIRKFLNPLMNTFTFFGKTGTSNYAHDNWFVGFDGKKLITIWTGLEGIRDTESLLISGASSSYKIYESYWLRSGKTRPDFDCPDSLISQDNEEQ